MTFLFKSAQRKRKEMNVHAKRIEKGKKKMKLKVVVGLMLTLCLMFTLFGGIPVRSQHAGKIKIGILGPKILIPGQHMREAAKIAVAEIMAQGGICVPAGRYGVKLIFADTLRGRPNPDAETGRQAAMELVAAGCDFVLGGFRTEATLAAREVLMDAAAAYGKPIFFVCGASTDEIVDCGGVYNYPLSPLGVHCGACVRDDYDRYKYTFRAAPMNISTLNTAIAGLMQMYALQKLLPLYGSYTGGGPLGVQVKFAIVAEALRWCYTSYLKLTIPAIYSTFFGGFGNLTYATLVSPLETRFASIITAIKASKAHLIVEMFSESAGRAFVTQARNLGFDGMIIGIDVPGQEIFTHWVLTGGNCEYETFLTASGSRTPITAAAVHLYDEFMRAYGHSPIYISYGIYDTIRAIKELIEGKFYVLPGDPYYGLNGAPINKANGALENHPYAGVGKWPMTADEMVPIIETTYRPHGILGILRYTGPQVENRTAWGTAPPNYMFAPILEDGAATYAAALSEGLAAYEAYWAAQGLPYDIMNVNPNALGTLHDLYVDENYAMWFYNNVRAMVGQWQQWPGKNPALEIVAPTYRLPPAAGGPPAIAKKFQTPPYCYTYGETDIAGNAYTPPNPVGWPNFWDDMSPTFPHIPFPKAFLWPDGIVSGADLLIGIGAWQSGAGDFAYDCRVDMNGDDFINIHDLSAMAMDWGVDGRSEISMYLGGTRNPDA